MPRETPNSTIDTDGDQGNQTGSIVATANHPFWVNEKGQWVEAQDLHLGELLSASSGKLLSVIASSKYSSTLRVRNLAIHGIHTYYVLAGNTPVLVHNTCGPNVSTRPGQIAGHFGYSTREVKDAIHAVKRHGLPSGGARRNSDVVVDLDTGEVYVKMPDGRPSDDLIGNIFDHLRER